MNPHPAPDTRLRTLIRWDVAMTLPVGLTLLRNIESDPRSYPIVMAGAVVVILPVLIVFTFLQRYIVAGLTAGAVK